MQPVARFARLPRADAVGEDDVVRCRVEELAGSEELSRELTAEKAAAVPGGPVQNEHCVPYDPRGIAPRCAERHVVNAELGKHGAIRESEIAHDEVARRPRCFAILRRSPRREQHEREGRCEQCGSREAVHGQIRDKGEITRVRSPTRRYHASFPIRACARRPRAVAFEWRLRAHAVVIRCERRVRGAPRRDVEWANLRDRRQGRGQIVSYSTDDAESWSQRQPAVEGQGGDSCVRHIEPARRRDSRFTGFPKSRGSPRTERWRTRAAPTR